MPSTKNMNAVFILVRPQYSGNLGSIARVLRNFGQKELRLVSPVARWNEDARRMAVGADSLVEKAPRFDSLQEAIDDLQWTAATASLRNRRTKENLSLRDAIKRLGRKASPNRIGFVFGPENSGLTDKEIALCHALVQIPASPSHPTLNLAQVVAIVAYELFVMTATTKVSRAFARSGSLEKLFSHLQAALLSIDFLQENNPDRMMKVMRRILFRAELNEDEVVVLRGICRQILNSARRAKDEG